jgi:hypothetical protein
MNVNDMNVNELPVKQPSHWPERPVSEVAVPFSPSGHCPQREISRSWKIGLIPCQGALCIMRLFRAAPICAFILAGALIPLSGCGSGTVTGGTSGFGVTPSGQPGVASIALNPSGVTGGTSAQISVTMAEPAPASGATVLLISSDPDVVPPQPLTIEPGQTTTTVAVPTSVVTESKSVTLSASYNDSSAGANLSVLPAASSFTVTVSPATVTAQQGKSGSSTVTTKASSGFNQSLQLSVSKEPNGVTATLNPKTIPAPGSGTSKLTLSVASSVHTGTYPLTVTATSGKTSQSATLTLKVTSGSSNPNATFKGCWYKQAGHRYQAVDVSVGNPGTYPFNAILYSGATCDPNSFADQFGFGQLITFGAFGYTFWFTDFKDQTGMSALWYVGNENSKCVNYVVAPDC